MVEENGPRTGSQASTAGLLSMLRGGMVLARHARLIILFTCIGIALGALSILLPPKYTAETMIMPPQSSSGMSSALSQLDSLSALGGAGALGLSSVRTNQDLYVALLQASTVQDSFIRRYSLEDEYRTHGYMRTRKVLKSHLEVDGTGKDGLIRVRMTDKNATRAALLANGYITEFQNFSRSLAISEASQRRQFFEQQLAEEKDKLTAAEENLRRSQQATGALELDAQTKTLIQSAAALRAQVAAKEVEVQSIRTYAGSGNVDLQQAETELASLRAELAKVAGPNPDSDAGLLVPKAAVPQAALDLIRNTREVKYHETLFAILERQLEAARMDEAKQGVSIQVIDKAIAPDQASSPSPAMKLIAGAAGGFILGVLVIVFLQFGSAASRDPEVRLRMQELRNSL